MCELREYVRVRCFSIVTDITTTGGVLRINYEYLSQSINGNKFVEHLLQNKMTQISILR